MEFALTPAEARTALIRARASRLYPADRDLYIFKAFRAKFGKDFYEWRSMAGDIEYDATDDGGFVMRDIPEDKPVKKARKPRSDRGAKRAKRTKAVKPIGGDVSAVVAA